MITNILPKHVLTEKLESLLGNVNEYLYFVGDNARNFIYGFPMVSKNFDFIAYPEASLWKALQGRLRAMPGIQAGISGPDSVKIELPYGYVGISPITTDEFLLSAAYAGDAVAMHVASGRLLCAPEYLTTPPTTIIRRENEFGLPPALLFKDADKFAAHREALKVFEEATKELAGSIQHATD